MSYDPFRNYRYNSNRKKYPNWFDYFEVLNADQDMEKIMGSVLRSLQDMAEPAPVHKVFKHIYTRTITANDRTFKVTVEELLEEDGEAQPESEDSETSKEEDYFPIGSNSPDSGYGKLYIGGNTIVLLEGTVGSL